MQIVNDARNITTDLGPVKLGVALDNPFDRSQGYNLRKSARKRTSPSYRLSPPRMCDLARA